MEAKLSSEVSSAGRIDAVYCPMHGGMRATKTADSDGLFLAAVRRSVGPKCLVVATLDLHANISEQMIQATDCMIAMRTNPHVDTAQRGEEAGESDLYTFIKLTVCLSQRFSHGAGFVLQLFACYKCSAA